MFNTIKDIKLDQLRKNHSRLYYFGLGFIQLKIDETYRLHFYSPELPSINEDIHNHRYHFTSKILKGTITNSYFAIGSGDSHLKYNESCNPEIKAPRIEEPCKADLVSIQTYQAGESYRITDDIFHTVKASDCITLLKRNSYTREFAQIVIPVGVQPVCPFSKKVDEEALWEIMGNMLK